MSGICDSPQFSSRKMSDREIELTAEIRRVTNGPTIQNKLSFGRAEALEHLNTLYEELHELQTDAAPEATTTRISIPVPGLTAEHTERAEARDRATHSQFSGEQEEDILPTRKFYVPTSKGA